MEASTSSRLVSKEMSRFRLPLVLAFALYAAGGAADAYAWGADGHRIIADVADAHLATRARKRIADILHGASMRDVAYFADEYRSTHRETSRWHFVNIEPGASDYVPERDCKNIPGQGDCIIAAIDRALADLKAGGEGQELALKFLIHFVGDLHQPFHAMTEARGGNEITVTYRGRRTNLHAVWDSDLIREARRMPSDYATFIEHSQIEGADFEVLTEGTTIAWALESRDIGLRALVPTGTEISDAYIAANVPTVEEQLALAGVRLAALLNNALK
jgi:hypothetical protein